MTPVNEFRRNGAADVPGCAGKQGASVRGSHALKP